MGHKKFFPYAKQSIDASDVEAVKEALSQELITRGHKTEEFEAALAERVSAKYAVAFTSATTGLYAAFQAADVSTFDRFITTPNSFIATVAAGMRLGAKPTFIDIDRKNGSMQIEGLKDALKKPYSRGRFVLAPVHFAGIAQDMKALDREVNSPDYVIIEDAAHAIGSHYPDGTLVGSCSHSHMTVFSFHAIKTITTGEGGAVTTNDERLYKRLRKLRNSGMEREHVTLQEAAPWYYEVQELSANYHMTEMQAALGLSQLKRLDSFIQKRQKLVGAYREHLSKIEGISLFDASYDERTSYHLMCVQIDFEKYKKSRTQIMQALKEDGIGTQYHYIPLYRQPVVMSILGDESARYPEMETYYKQALSLPLYIDLEEDDVAYIASCLAKRLKE